MESNFKTSDLYQLNPSKIIVYSTVWCADCRRARQVFFENNVQYHDVDIEKDEKAQAFVQQVNNGFNSVPTIIFPDGTKLVEPNSPELIEKLKQLSLIK